MSEPIAYDRTELRKITRAFKAMDEEAVAKARSVSGALATKLSNSIKAASSSQGIGAQRVAYGVRVSKSSRIGEFSYGFQGQRFSGGGTTKALWPGLEFGSNRYRQFAPASGPGPNGRGSKGKFIYPTLRSLQPYIVREWENAFGDIVKEWTK